jgi:hypothetical protein
MKQIPTESMKRYIKIWIQERGFCPFAMPGNGESYCHFLNWDYCPYDRMEKQPTEIFEIPQRKFYRCLL